MINIVDGIPGLGKTQFAIQMINNHVIEFWGDFESSDAFSRNFLYVTPYIDEVKRIHDSVDAEIIDPNTEDSKTKSKHLSELINEGKSVVMTHSLFLKINDSLFSILEKQGYTLILDEVIDPIEPVDITKSDINILKNSNSIEIDSTGKVFWMNQEYNDEFKKTNRFNDIKTACERERLYSNEKQSIFVEMISPKLFKSFENIYVLTYLFEGQILKYYFDYFNMKYQLHSVKKENNQYQLIPLNRKNEDRTFIKENLEIYEDKRPKRGPKPSLNFSIDQDPSNGKNYLSSSWLKTASEDNLKKLQNNIRNYFNNLIKCKTTELFWTTLKEKASDLKSDKNTYHKDSNKDNFLFLNIKATNEYRERKAAAYIYSRYMIPDIKLFFNSWRPKNDPVDEDIFALSELIQFIFRGRIREGKKLYCYIPSHRMRTLLCKWLNHEL
ncbi:hypothetical protein [Staphylococcus hominis]|uniref:hypothetical protein n=1 Tax=Staphylococcus hominis TaxID=1290 RepID=UPI001F570D38|nr:hypothetical protein [Staphylococcus hominis]MCI2908888.1 hypothetical protein [Staphylococcus hominis]